MPKTTAHTTNYPFGSTQPNPNNLNANQYRYGFGGMEQDKQSSSYTTYFRQYDPRIARWKSTDPVIQPWQSPYTAFDNNPILYVDPMGDVSWCGIGTVFSGLASFAGNMALRALPTLGLNIALNNFLPNATHTGNNSGRFLGVDGGTTSNNTIPEEVRNKGGYWLDEFEVVDNAPKNFWDGMVKAGGDFRNSVDYYLKALADGKWDIVWNFIYSTSFGSMGNQQIYPGSESEITIPASSYEWGQAVFNMLPYILAKRVKTQWGWSGTYVWKGLVNKVKSGGTIESLSGKIPTKNEALKLIEEAGGKVQRIEGPHLSPNPHNYNHINYSTPSGGKGTIRIQDL